MEIARAQGTGPGAEELALNSLARQVISRSHFTRGMTGGEGKQIEVKEDWEAKGAEWSCFSAGERAASRGSQV